MYMYVYGTISWDKGMGFENDFGCPVWVGLLAWSEFRNGDIRDRMDIYIYMFKMKIIMKLFFTSPSSGGKVG